MCMACPTVADATGYGFTKTSVNKAGTGASATFSANTANNGTTLTNYADINTATNKDVANACVTDILGTSTDGSTATLQAQWKENFSTITLNANTAENGYGSGSFSNPAKLYGIKNGGAGDDKVYKTKDSNGNLKDPIAVSSVILGTIPTGKTVNHTLNYNWGSVSSAGGDTYNYSDTVTGKFTKATSTGKARPFKGVYSAATNGTQYIDANKKLLSAGLSAAKAGSVTTWYAQYNCASITPTNPTLTGYTFGGWYKEAALTNAYTQCINANDTVYAKWTPKTYTVTYNANKPTAASGVTLADVTGMPASGSAPLSATFDRGYTAASAPSLTGYTFDGWKANYKITTGATAGTASAPTQGYGAGEVIANPSASTPTRWKTDASDVTFVAQWVANNYTITLDKNGGTADGSTALYTKYNTNLYSDSNRTTPFTTTSTITKPTGPATTLSYNLHLPTNPRTNSAYTTPATPASTTVNRAFSGFYDNQTAGTIRIDSTGKMTAANITWAKGLSANTTLWARWGNAAHTTKPAQTLTGYMFDGWYPTYSNGTVSGTKVDPSSTYNITADKTLHAKWIANSGKIRFNCGKQADGTTNVTGDGPYDMTWRYDTQVTEFPLTVTDSQCSYPGYVFAGWDCSDNISTTGNPETATGHYIYRAETTTNSSTGAVRGVISGHNPNTGWYQPTNPTSGSDIICTALWMPGSITVKWNTNNGSPASIADGSCTYDSSVTLPTNPTRTGYIFDGWNVQQ